MFYTIRFILSAALFGIAMIFAKHFHGKDKRRWIISSILVSICILMGLVFVPFENAFVSFHSIEQLIHYISPKNSVIMAVEGDESTLVISETRNSKDNKIELALNIVSGSDNEWKLNTPTQPEKIGFDATENGSYEIYRYRNTEDYYFIINVLSDSNPYINDSHGSSFELMPLGKESFVKQCYVVYVHAPTEDYWLQVDDARIHPFANEHLQLSSY